MMDSPVRNLALFVLPLALSVSCSSARALEPAPAAPEAAAPTTPARAAGAPLVFTAREGWVEEEPASAMRAAQYRLPGDGAGEASLIVYHFGDGGGSVEANLERWAGQFEQPDGGSSSERMSRRDHTIDGREVTEVDLSGTFVAETFPGSGEHVNEPDSRMLAAILASDHGRYYVKLVGPAATVALHERAYREFLRDVR